MRTDFRNVKYGLHDIAKHYGTESQCRMAQEECAELIMAVSKYMRAKGTLTPANEIEECVDNVAEECADVLITVLQVTELVCPNHDILGIMQAKIERQKKRIESEGQ